MIVRNYFSHTIPGTSYNVFHVLDQKGYCYQIAGENIGWNNYPDDVATATIQNQFMDSPGHRANILGKAWDVIGIGAYKGPTARRCGPSSSPTAAARPPPTEADPEADAEADAGRRRSPPAEADPRSRPRSRRPKPTPDADAARSDAEPTDELGLGLGPGGQRTASATAPRTATAGTAAAGRRPARSGREPGDRARRASASSIRRRRPACSKRSSAA